MYELTIYRGGTAILTDHEGNPVWTSDSDEEFMADFEGFITIDDEDVVLDYLEEAGYIEEGDDVEVKESSSSGLAEPDDDDDEDDSDDDDEDLDDDDDDDEGGWP